MTATQKQWIDPTGYPCCAVQNMLRVWCGYVGVPQDHPWYGLPYNAMVQLPKSWLDRPRSMQSIGIIPLFLSALRGDKLEDGIELSMALEIHGGLTYADDYVPQGDYPNEGKGYYWFGFDCGHAGDKIEGMERLGGLERDLEYVVGECSSLAQQLHDVAALIRVDEQTLVVRRRPTLWKQVYRSKGKGRGKRVKLVRR